MFYKLEEFYKRSKVTFIFLAIMIGYFIIMSINGGTTNAANLVRFGALFPPFILQFNQYFRFITAIFIHIGIVHLYFNSYALYIFGPQMERLMGSRNFLIFFLLTGIGGNIATFFFNFNTVSAGASGGLFGIFGAFFYMIRKHSNMITSGGRKQILRLLGINLAITILVPSISITAHLGGFVIGYLLSFIFIKRIFP